MPSGKPLLVPLRESFLLALGKSVVIGALPDLLQLSKSNAGNLIALFCLSLLLPAPLLLETFLLPALLIAEDIGLLRTVPVILLWHLVRSVLSVSRRIGRGAVIFLRCGRGLPGG